MSVRTIIETSAAALTALAMFASFLWWINAQGVEGQERMTRHVLLLHTNPDSVVLDRLDILERKVERIDGKLDVLLEVVR